ncbi:alpha/beta fold hydrolase [Mycobacterium lehmannii]|uniref:alpha/beta fold hydrolase n=1 Tax=Mycobacterium lehmannii TaxID=2048550 RepID=UPI000B93E5D2|nr:alpha/beta hydrolase [Mycobacterium lehmannii]
MTSLAATTATPRPGSDRALPHRLRAGHDDHPADVRLRVTAGDDVELAVHDYGDRCADRTVVFLHGLCLTGASMSRQIEYLRRRCGDTLRVISYDHRGHGASDSAAIRSYTVEQLGADLAAILSALDVAGAVTFVGHSMGGMAALAYLARHQAQRPIDPHGLVLIATAAGRLGQRGLGRLLDTPITAALFGAAGYTPERAAKALSRPLCAALSRYYCLGHPQRTTLGAAAVAALATTPVTTAVGFLTALRRFNAYSTLASICARTAILSGGADLLTPPAHSRDLAAGIPHATRVHLAHAGHMLPYEAPHVVNQAIARTISPPPARQPARHTVTPFASDDRQPGPTAAPANTATWHANRPRSQQDPFTAQGTAS